jgi:hypothetical protein
MKFCMHCIYFYHIFLHININVPFSFAMNLTIMQFAIPYYVHPNIGEISLLYKFFLFFKCSLWWFNLTDPHNAQHFIFVKIFKLELVQSLKSSFLECQLRSYGWNYLACFFYIIINMLFISHFDATNIQSSKKLKTILIKQLNNNCIFKLINLLIQNNK